MRSCIRAQPVAEVNDRVARVQACFEGAAKATGCRAEHETEETMHDLRDTVT